MSTTPEPFAPDSAEHTSPDPPSRSASPPSSAATPSQSPSPSARPASYAYSPLDTATASGDESDATMRKPFTLNRPLPALPPAQPVLPFPPAGAHTFGHEVAMPSTPTPSGSPIPRSSSGSLLLNQSVSRWPRKRKLMVAAGAALLVVGVVLAGAIGGTRARDAQQSDSTSSSVASAAAAADVSSSASSAAPSPTVVSSVVVASSSTSPSPSPSPSPTNAPLRPLDVWRGVNIGGWIVPEPFIVPSIFRLPNGTYVRDEWTLCSVLGKTACTDRLRAHYDTFITEDDIRQIAAAGLNIIRIPLNYWAVYADPTEPYVVDIGWFYVDRAIGWARKYGLNVKLDLHDAPGCQNPWGLSGRESYFQWQNNPGAYFDRTTATLLEIVRRLQGPNYTHVKFLELLNEPDFNDMQQGVRDQITGWYASALTALRALTSNTTAYPTGGPKFAVGDGFLFLNVFNGQTPAQVGLGEVVMDFHFYAIYTQNELLNNWQQRIQEACQDWAGRTRTYNQTRAPTVVGEFSSAWTDCTRYINGFFGGYRSDGTLSAGGYTNSCQCSCSDANLYNYAAWDAAKVDQLRQWTEVQMDMAEKNGLGWIYWTWKTENNTAPDFDYQLGLKQGWIPKDPTPGGRKYGC